MDMLVGQAVAMGSSYKTNWFLPGLHRKRGRIRVFVRELGYVEEG